MIKKPILVLFLALIMLAPLSRAEALTPAVIGGIRGGLALGMCGEERIQNNIDLKFGLEADTDSNPFVFFFGGKFYLTKVARYVPMSFNAGLVAYAGNRSDVGLYLALTFDNLFENRHVFADVGIDAAGSGRLQAQMGYYF